MRSRGVAELRDPAPPASQQGLRRARCEYGVSPRRNQSTKCQRHRNTLIVGTGMPALIVVVSFRVLSFLDAIHLFASLVGGGNFLRRRRNRLSAAECLPHWLLQFCNEVWNVWYGHVPSQDPFHWAQDHHVRRVSRCAGFLVDRKLGHAFAA
jgi:hypothetical protein